MASISAASVLAFLSENLRDVAEAATVVTVVVKIVVGSSSGGMIALVELLGDPDLDERLASDAETGCLTVEFSDHPRREVHVHPPGFLTGPPRPSGYPKPHRDGIRRSCRNLYAVGIPPQCLRLGESR